METANLSSKMTKILFNSLLLVFPDLIISWRIGRIDKSNLLLSSLKSVSYKKSRLFRRDLSKRADTRAPLRSLYAVEYT